MGRNSSWTFLVSSDRGKSLILQQVSLERTKEESQVLPKVQRLPVLCTARKDSGAIT